MDKGYEVYCLADPVFYDTPVQSGRASVEFTFARRSLPAGWQRAELDDWLMYAPADARLPNQGWKIHSSACLHNAEEILEVVADYCVARRIPFKFIRSADMLFLRNAKYADRGGSGKFATIYPADEAQLQTTLAELGELLDGQPGPYILSDLRWGAGPLYVRYGGFADMYCVGANGAVEPAILDDAGELVPDRRGPTFQLPSWVTLPSFLEPHLAARADATIAELPYAIERALHFSNGGGIYAGRDERSGERVVLKEARPHAGLSVDRADAVARLEHERDMLERLAGLDLVPAVRDHFVLGEHHFLVQEYIEGTALAAMFVERYPLLLPRTDAKQAGAYVDWALAVYARLERAVDTVHQRGIVLGDLHPSNVLVRPDGRIALIDLEVASEAAERRTQALADPAFMPADRRTGFDLDRYALACIRLFMFMPLTMLLGVDPLKAQQLAADIAELFPVPAEFLSEAVSEIAGDGDGGCATSLQARRTRRRRLEPTPSGWRGARESMSRAILASATPERDDRLFPGDVKQFTEGGGLNLAYGAAGVLYALAATGCGRFPDHEAWLVQHASDPQPGTPPGFYDGLHGVAFALDRLGRRETALAILEICRSELEGKLGHLALDLFSGLAGIGLNLLHFAQLTDDRTLVSEACGVAELVAERLGAEDSVAPISGGEHTYAGLLRGSSGPALLFLRMFEETAESRWLDVAATALGQDLRRCVHRPEDGALEVTEGWRTMPYLADGSVGIGLALDKYLTYRDDARFAQAAADIHKAAESQFYIEPGLFYGRAGMILYLSQVGARATRRPDPVAAAQVRRLAWHAMDYAGGLAFPGEQLLRLSMDLATGTAGVLLALGAALGDEQAHLPFIGPVAADLDTAARGQLLSAGGR